jgi:hypothetical protein
LRKWVPRGKATAPKLTAAKLARSSSTRSVNCAGPAARVVEGGVAEEPRSGEVGRSGEHRCGDVDAAVEGGRGERRRAGEADGVEADRAVQVDVVKTTPVRWRWRR